MVSLHYPARDIFCTSCGGKAKGCDACDETGVQAIDAPPREDGLPWHPHAVQDPTDLHAPDPISKPRRRAPADASDVSTPATSTTATTRRRRAR